MNSQDLDGVGIGIKAPAALLPGSALDVHLGDALRQPGPQRRDAHLAGCRLRVEQFRDVTQIGELAFAADGGDDPGRQSFRGGDRPVQGGHPVPGEQRRPFMGPGVHGFPRALVGGGDFGRSEANKWRERHGCGP